MATEFIYTRTALPTKVTGDKINNMVKDVRSGWMVVFTKESIFKVLNKEWDNLYGKIVIKYIYKAIFRKLLQG